MFKRLQWAEQHLNDMREFLMNEPRGHAAMFGALLMPTPRQDADHGVLFMSASGFLGMCGHGTIGVATVIVEKGLAKVSEPITEVRLDTPAGVVAAHVRVDAGKVVDVTFTNVRRSSRKAMFVSRFPASAPRWSTLRTAATSTPSLISPR